MQTLFGMALVVFGLLLTSSALSLDDRLVHVMPQHSLRKGEANRFATAARMMGLFGKFAVIAGALLLFIAA